MQISARPATKPAANEVPFAFALGVTSIRMIAMIGMTLIAAPSAYGRISPIALPIASIPAQPRFRVSQQAVHGSSVSARSAILGRSRSAGHAGLCFREGTLEVLRAPAVDLRDRFPNGARECRVDGVGLGAVVDRDDSGRAAGQRGAHLVLE